MESVSHKVYQMEILRKEKDDYFISIRSGRRESKIIYSPQEKRLEFVDKKVLTYELQKNEYQLRKILHNKRPDTFYVGFKLKFILKDNANAIAFNDLGRLIILDRRNGQYEVQSIEKRETLHLQIFTDGCYLEKYKKGAYAALFKKSNGLLDIRVGKSKSTSSSLIELLAVIEGLKSVEQVKSLRIISDSRYVIKGLTEWMFNWKLNDWHTAQGERVKNIKYWQEFDRLTEGKYIEFEWVKGHSSHFENTLCDFYAKQEAVRE